MNLRNFGIEIRVTKPGELTTTVTCLEIDPREYAEEMSPIQETDDPFMRVMEEDLPTVAAMKKDKRKDFARRISEELTQAIVQSLANRDTFNGYAVVKSDD